MKEKIFYLLQSLLFGGGFLLCNITWADYHFWTFISVVGVLLQALAAAWFIRTLQKRSFAKKTQFTILIVFAFLVCIIATLCFVPSLWIVRLQAARLLDDEALVDVGREECNREKDSSKRANVLLWMTLHINPLGAHTTEELAEIILASGCRKQYTEKANEFLSSKTIKEDQREMLVLYIRECEKAN